MILFILACSDTQKTEQTPQKPKEETAAVSSIRVYSGRSEALVGDLFSMAEKELGMINAITDKYINEKKII